MYLRQSLGMEGIVAIGSMLDRFRPVSIIRFMTTTRPSVYFSSSNLSKINLPLKASLCQHHYTVTLTWRNETKLLCPSNIYTHQYAPPRLMVMRFNTTTSQIKTLPPRITEVLIIVATISFVTAPRKRRCWSRRACGRPNSDAMRLSDPSYQRLRALRDECEGEGQGNQLKCRQSSSTTSSVAS